MLPQVTEDMTRGERQRWVELGRFMAKVKSRRPELTCFLKLDKLYIDNRLFMVDDDGQVVEQPVVNIPNTPAKVHPGLHVKSHRTKLNDKHNKSVPRHKC